MCNKNDIVFEKADLKRRFFASMFDYIFVLILSFIVFSISGMFLRNSAVYQENVNKEKIVMIESGLYVKKDDESEQVFLITDFYDQDTTSDDEKKYFILREAVDSFYLDLNCYQKSEDYGKIRLNKFLDDSDMFYIVDENYVLKSEKTFKEGYDFYKNILTNDAIGQLINEETYLNASKDNFIMTIWILFLSYVVSIIILFYVVPLIFKRGRKTFGRLIFKIGLVDKHGINVKLSLFTVKFIIFLILEAILSVFAFMLPFCVSVGMAVLSKTSQNFSEYMTNTYSINDENKRVYLNYEENILKEE